MPSYCSTFQSINFVPLIGDMELFKPYFIINDGETSFDVVIKVPSNCYFVASSASGFPPAGACGSPSDKNHLIEIDQTPNCTDTTEKLLNATLPYREDPTGEIINIYIMDKSNANSITGNKSKITVQD